MTTVEAHWIKPPDLAPKFVAEYERLVDVMARAFPEKIESVIVSATREDRLDVNGIWVFTKNYFGGSEPPRPDVGRMKFDISSYKDRIDYIEVSYLDFDLETAHANSRYRVAFTTTDGNSATLDAIGEQSGALHKFLLETIHCNLDTHDV